MTIDAKQFPHTAKAIEDVEKWLSKPSLCPHPTTDCSQCTLSSPTGCLLTPADNFRRMVEAQELQALLLYSADRPKDLGKHVQPSVDAAAKLLATKIAHRHLKTELKGGGGK